MNFWQDYFFLIYPFSWTNGKSFSVFQLTRQCWQQTAHFGLLEVSLTMCRTSRCSRYVLSPAEQHKHFFFFFFPVSISVVSFALVVWCNVVHLVSLNQSTGQTQPLFPYWYPGTRSVGALQTQHCPDPRVHPCANFFIL